MVKTTKKPVEAVVEATPKTGQTFRMVTKRVYTFTLPGLISEGIAPQARSILNNLGFENGTAIEESLLKTRVEELAAQDILRTRQDPMRIFLYYRAQMIAKGYLTYRAVTETELV